MNARVRKMSFLNDFCCICMNKSDLKHIFDMDNNGLSHYNKLTTSIVEMDFKEMNDQRLICGECCVTLNTVYNFRQTCLRGKTNLITYISQLQTSSHVIDTIEIKKEIEIKCENEGDGFEGVSNSHCLLKIKNDPDEIVASICCICMNKSDLKHLFDVDYDGVSRYNKLTSSIAEMYFKEMNNERLICGECCVTLNTVYNFRQTCLRSKTNLITYLSQLQTSNHVIDKIKIEKEIDIKCENEVDDFEDLSISHCLVKIKSDPDDISASNKCCTCMNKSNLKHLFDVDNDGISHYNKLTSSIAEMNFKEMNNQRLICGECCVTLNTVYNFRQTCLRSKTNLITYISQLQTFSPVSGVLSVRLKDIKQKIMILTEEIDIKCENEDSNCLEENNPQSNFQIESFKDIIHSPASIKEEFESEEEDSSAHEDATAGHVNEGDVKVEIEHQTVIEEEIYSEFSEPVLEEDPLAVVKEEPVSEIPQGGSTSQGTSGVPMESQGTIEENEGLHKCEMCEKSFRKLINFNNHMQMHSDIRSYKCELCNKSFAYKSKLTMHFLKCHSEEKPFECEICKKQFYYKSDAQRHMRIHSGDTSYECVICNRSFILPHRLTAHMKTHFGESRNECEICKKVFTHKKNLINHLRIHSGERLFECEVCKKSFFKESTLNIHMDMHSGERKYECDICKKCFFRKRNLNAHLRIHANEKQYKCEICNMDFIQKSYLIRHMVLHSPKKKFECEICKKTFTLQKYLAYHSRIHTGEKPHQCELCKKRFSQKSGLNVHMNTHSGERKFKCELCTRTFNQKGALNRHIQKHSSENTE